VKQRTIDLGDLDVVGYAESLTREMVPHVVPPVFRFRDDPHKIVFPPFRIREDRVEGATVGTVADLERFTTCGDVTCIEPFDAKPDHDLWIDEEMVLRYQPHTTIRGTFSEIVRQRIDEARQAIRDDRLDEAKQALRIAFNADNRFLDVLVLEAVVYRLEGNGGFFEVLQELAEPICEESTFRHLVEWQASDLGASHEISVTNESGTPVQERARA